MVPLLCCVLLENIVESPVVSLLMLQVMSQAPLYCTAWKHLLLQHHAVLQDMTQAKLRAASALQAAQEERDQLAERVQLQARQLQEEQAQTDSLAAERDSLQGGANRHRIRVSPTGSVKDSRFIQVQRQPCNKHMKKAGCAKYAEALRCPSMPRCGLWQHQ